MELQSNLMLVKADLRRKAETLAQVKSAPHQLLPSGSDPAASSGLCKKRGHGAAAPCNTENRPPLKQPFFPSLFPTRTYNSRLAEEAKVTPYTRILRSRQPSPPRSPASTPRSLRGKYWDTCSFSRKVFFWIFCTNTVLTKIFILLVYIQLKVQFIQLFQIEWSLWIIINFGNWGWSASVKIYLYNLHSVCNFFTWLYCKYFSHNKNL